MALRNILPVLAITLPGSLALSACNRGLHEPPPRANDAIHFEPQASLITVPVHADLSELAASLDREIPRVLWTIDKPDQTCVKSKEVDIGIATLKTPKLKCRIIGEVTRGSMTFAGHGKEIRLTLPLHAELRAEDIGGVLKRETATADATAHATVRITLAEDWTPRGTVDIRYDWTNAPHAEFLGQRIDFTEQADRKIAPIIARLERDLPGQLGRLELRRQVEQAWKSAFTTLSLNRENPPVWMRVKPTELQYGGYEIDGKRLLLRLGLKAQTETFVGRRPEDPAPAPLPPVRPLEAQAGRLAFFIPVIADYRELEPVLVKALRKRSARPFTVPGVGPVRADFHKVTIYGTTGGRIAVGATFTARDEAGRLGRTKGTVWMTGTPVNARDSRRVGFENFEVSGTTDMRGGDLILRLANTPGMSATIAGALAQNFENDYAELLGKIAHAIEDKREGDLVIRAKVTKTQTGRITAAGRGLYLPVWADGTASITVKD
ncbi:DUF4403 family protein [Novosphingobium guangzhouense]|uniref:DUF4403 domain-containing protein n=1 Tax=Novosphingobium guangzhouense TaxID=1850347 RepID=A0A2K2FT86_9SPHN|nr:DUF4403 family protein [Novosphingobium guangzhouense]PNU01986.1 hypothetical protein A8V01_11075 [Novosphingobium guangzhouense]